jgi:hypothetical protein
MRKLVVILAVALTTPSGAKVWVTAYCCDETTPLVAVDPNYPTVYQDIMVGTRLVLIVRSDTAAYWRGRLQLSSDDAQYATLSGRGYTATQPGSTVLYRNYLGSCLASAGGKALVRSVTNAMGTGFEFSTTVAGASTGTPPTVAGEWFVIDYRAQQAGACDVALYDLDVNFYVPIQMLSFAHVPSRDFNGDALVNFQDFALLASHWDSAMSPDPNGPEAAFDLDGNARVDFRDIARFSEYWLERTDCSKPASDPNDLSTDSPL